MRKDIQINTTTGDIVFKNRNTLNKQLFKWLSESDLFITAQISLPSNFDVNQLYTIGVNIEIPYTPINLLKYVLLEISVVEMYAL